MFMQLVLLTLASVLMTNIEAKVKDPTKPVFFSQKKTPVRVQRKIVHVPLVLNSILISEQRRLAVINNVLVGVGDMVDKAKIVEINRDYVIVVRQKKSSRLAFGQSIRKIIRPITR
ncbi:MAG: hypothetical protein ACC707_12635 [Thiohalomonadales bacterium]